MWCCSGGTGKPRSGPLSYTNAADVLAGMPSDDAAAGMDESGLPVGVGMVVATTGGCDGSGHHGKYISYSSPLHDALSTSNWS